MKLNKLTLNETEHSKLSHFARDKLSVENVLTFYTLAKLYKTSSFVNFSQSSPIEACLVCIERCFLMVVGSESFLHSDFDLVAKMLESSELSVHSELEVFDAADRWVNHDVEKRGKHAKRLLLKVRLELLSKHALRHALRRESPFAGNQECVEALKEALVGGKTFGRNESSGYRSERFCSQKNFKILVCGGIHEFREKHMYGSGYTWRERVVRKVHQVDGRNLNSVKVLAPMKQERKYFKAVCLKGEVYVLGGRDRDSNVVTSVEKYSPSADEWSRAAEMVDDREYYCACAFMDKILVFGAYYYERSDHVTASCLQLDPGKKKWKELAGMGVARDSAACAVFRGDVVVSGGQDNGENRLRSVESYDVIGDVWRPMPNMVHGKSEHSMAVSKGKLFVFGYGAEACEVFDGEKFAVLRSPYFVKPNRAVLIGNKFVITQEYLMYMYCYDADKDEWSEVDCEFTWGLVSYASVIVPWY